MSQPFISTGGAQVGWVSASPPLARLVATPEALTLSVRFLIAYKFAPTEVASIERHTVWLFGDVGIKIRHCQADFPERITFGSSGDAEHLLTGILEAGFLPIAS